jgi:hypothetical protein
MASAVGLCAPLLVGMAVHDLTAGLTAGLGAFTALFGKGRPYLHRAVLLVGIAVGLTAAVVIGALAGRLGGAAFLVVAAAAGLAAFLCAALDTGPRPRW